MDNGRTVSYVYDALGRITNATTVGSTNYPKWGLSWTYDRYSNRTAQSISSGCSGLTCPTSSVTVSATTNRISGSPYAYDANGNMTNDGLNALTYDAENRAVSATGSLGAGTYVFDPNGLRIEKIVSGATTVYVFAGTKVIAEYASGAAPGSPSKEYIYSGSQLIATIAGTTTTYHLSDHLSVRANTDTSGNILADGQGHDIGSQGHFPFGETWYIGSGGTKWQFTGYERDAESINDYATARSYVDRLGRFSSIDLLGGEVTNPQSLNLYSYVLNDPCSLVDPLGLTACKVTVRIKIKHKAVNPDQLKTIEKRVQDIFSATKTDNGDTFNVTFVDSGKADYTLNIDPNIDFSEAGHVSHFLGFWGTPVVHIGSELELYHSGNDAYVALGTDIAHELTHRVGHIGDLPYNSATKDANLMNVDSAIDQQNKNPNLPVPSDPAKDWINPDVSNFAKLTAKEVQRLIDKSHCKQKGLGSSFAVTVTLDLCSLFHIGCAPRE